MMFQELLVDLLMPWQLPCWLEAVFLHNSHCTGLPAASSAKQQPQEEPGPTLSHGHEAICVCWCQRDWGCPVVRSHLLDG